MRILLVSGSMPPMRCGVGDYTAALASALAHDGDNHVAVLTSRSADRHPGLSYEVLPCIERWDLREATTIWRVFRQWKPDVVHFQYPTQGYDDRLLASLIPLLAWMAGATSIRTWHEAFSGRQSVTFLLQSIAPGPRIVVRPNFRALMWRWLRPMLGPRATMIAGASSIPLSSLNRSERRERRNSCAGSADRLVVFFGFLLPAKGVEQLFEIAEPARDTLVIAGEADADPDYAAKIKALAASDIWSDRSRLAGFLPASDTADLLAIADVVVLPFVTGGGSWNSSISAALLQGTPVVTTSRERHGLDDTGQVYFAEPNNIADIKYGMTIVKRREPDDARDTLLNGEWARIRDDHLNVYRGASNPRARDMA